MTPNVGKLSEMKETALTKPMRQHKLITGCGTHRETQAAPCLSGMSSVGATLGTAFSLLPPAQSH